MQGWIADFRQALRQMRKSLGFTAVVVLTLALGIGANTTVFSVVDAVLLRPLPYTQPERLVEAESWYSRNMHGNNLSYPDFFDWRAQNKSFEHLVSYHDGSYTLTGVERAIHVDAEIVSWDLLPALGVNPEIGRGFTKEEEKRGTRVALLSHALWESQFGSDKKVTGRTIDLNGERFTVIGVMPATFRFPITAPKTGMWTTLAVDDTATGDGIRNRGSHFLNALGRLKPGVTVAQADEEMKAITAQLTKQYPKTNTKHDSAKVQSELDYVLGDTKILIEVILCAVALVLLIACGNIANLLLARVRDRRREIAMRTALGATRVRIVRQLLIESMALSVAGGVAGCILAFLCTPAVLRLIGESVPRAANAGVNVEVLAFGLAAAVISGIVFGMVPAVTASKTELVSTLKTGGASDMSGHDRLRSAVIVCQVALGIVLTAGAGLLISSFVKLTHKDLGFLPDHLLTYRFELPDSRYEKRRPEFYRDYFEKLRALPGVQSAAGTMILPMTSDNADVSFENPEQPVPEGQRPGADISLITPEYFHTMGTPILQGRDFNDADVKSSMPVMIINKAFAEKYFPNENPIGKKLKPGAGDEGPPPMREIVGVVGDMGHWITQRNERPGYFLPSAQMPGWCCLITVMRTGVDPRSLEPMARQLVASMDKDLPVTDLHTMLDLISLQMSQPRFAMVLLGAFAALALLLTIVGLCGVMMYSVSRRTREIGVRLALGAQRTMVLRMILYDAGRLLAVGILLGLTASLAFASVMKTMLYGTQERDPMVLTLVCVVVAVAGMFAAYLPALRAAHTEPMQALRTE
jgi:putative ABC transport system permease protein